MQTQLNYSIIFLLNSITLEPGNDYALLFYIPLLNILIYVSRNNIKY